MIGLESALKLVEMIGKGFGWIWGKVSNGTSKDGPGIKIPRKSLIVLPTPYPHILCWTMGANIDKPAMQIVGEVRVTNITTYDIYPTAKMKEAPRVDVLSITLRSGRSRVDGILSASTVDLRFMCFIEPPVRKKGEPFVSKVAIVDQFGNEHWSQKIEFESR